MTCVDRTNIHLNGFRPGAAQLFANKRADRVQAMHRFYLPVAGLCAALAILVFQTKTPGTLSPEFAIDIGHGGRTDVASASIQIPDLTLPAIQISSGDLAPVEVTQNTADNDARVQSIVSFLNREDPDTPVEVLAMHTVLPGDSIASIASQYYGDQSQAKEIYLANRHQLTSDNTIKVGQSLRIPVLSGL